MKILMRILAIIIVFVEILVLVICFLLLMEFFRNPEPFNDFYFGSEAMVENGGWQYRSVFSYIFFNSIMIIFSILFSFLALKSRKIKFILLLLLLVICQIGCLILL